MICQCHLSHETHGITCRMYMFLPCTIKTRITYQIIIPKWIRESQGFQGAETFLIIRSLPFTQKSYIDLNQSILTDLSFAHQTGTLYEYLGQQCHPAPLLTVDIHGKAQTLGEVPLHGFRMRFLRAPVEVPLTDWTGCTKPCVPNTRPMIRTSKMNRTSKMSRISKMSRK